MVLELNPEPQQREVQDFHKLLYKYDDLLGSGGGGVLIILYAERHNCVDS